MSKPSLQSSTRTWNVQELESNVSDALSAAKAGLEHFLEVVEASGLSRGVQEYRNLQAVLVQQRLWADRNNCTELMRLFEPIAKTAAELHRIFHAYAETMKRLKEIDKLRAAETGPAPQP